MNSDIKINNNINNNINKDTNKFPLMLSIITLIILILSIGCIIYTISGLIIIINDYDYSKNCDNSNLGIYSIISLVILFKNFINIKYDKSNNNDYNFILILIIQFVVDFGMSIWGGLELFNIPTKCYELENSHLKIWALVTFSLQILSSAIILIILLYLFYNKNNYQTEKNVGIQFNNPSYGSSTNI